MVKTRRARARKAKLEEESGMTINRVHTSGWPIDDNNNDNSIKKTTNTFMNDTDGNEDMPLGKQTVTVPLTITMLIIVAYICIGSLLFHSFEEWNMIQAAYFCFITLGIENIKCKNR